MDERTTDRATGQLQSVPSSRLGTTQVMVINAIPLERTARSQLTRWLNLSPATLSQTVDSLEERDL